MSAKPGSDSDALHGQWTSSIVNKQIDRLLSGADADDAALDLTANDDPVGSEQPEQRRSSLKVVSKVNVVATPPHSSDHIAPKPSQEVQPSHADPAACTVSDYALPTLPEQLNSSRTQKLQLPLDFWKLLDVYYTYTHSWLPISEKNDTLKVAYSYLPDGLNAELISGGSGTHAELWAIVALAAQQSKTSMNSSEADMLMVNAQQFIPALTGDFELGHIRALLLMSLIYIGRRAWVKAWMLIGTAVRLVLTLDLRLKASMTKFPAINSNSRLRHITLACFVVESIVCMYMKKPQHLSISAISSVDLLDEDALEEWTPWDGPGVGHSRQPARTLSTFNLLVCVLGRDPLTAESNALAIPIESLHTPQQIHLKLIADWRASLSGSISSKETMTATVQAVERMLSLGGVPAVPPTVIPMFEGLLKGATADVGMNACSNPAMVELLRAWKIRIDVQPRMTPHAGTQNAGSSGLWDAANTLRTMSVPRFISTSLLNPSVTGSASNWVQSFGNTATAQVDHAQLHNGVMSTAESIPEARFAQYGDELTPSFFSDGGSNPADFDAIFEEIAMLDRSRHAHDGAKFMQNLGVNPDLDLSDFFGPDYQTSDPMLAYLQPEMPGPSAPSQTNTLPEG